MNIVFSIETPDKREPNQAQANPEVAFVFISWPLGPNPGRKNKKKLALIGALLGSHAAPRAPPHPAISHHINFNIIAQSSLQIRLAPINSILKSLPTNAKFKS